MYLRTLIETGAHRVGEECYSIDSIPYGFRRVYYLWLQAPEPAPAPVCKFTRACLPANLRAGIKLPLSCTVAINLLKS